MKTNSKPNHSTMKTKLQILVAGVLLATVGTGLSQPCITITTEPQGADRLRWFSHNLERSSDRRGAAEIPVAASF